MSACCVKVDRHTLEWSVLPAATLSQGSKATADWASHLAFSLADLSVSLERKVDDNLAEKLWQDVLACAARVRELKSEAQSLVDGKPDQTQQDWAAQAAALAL